MEEGHKISETARNLGINANMPIRRKGELEQPAEAREAEDKNRRELNRLKKENRRLRMERETLKKSDGPLCAPIRQRHLFIRRYKRPIQ